MESVECQSASECCEEECTLTVDNKDKKNENMYFDYEWCSKNVRVAVENAFLISCTSSSHFTSNGQMLLSCIQNLNHEEFKKDLTTALIDILISTNVFTLLSQIKESIWANFHQSFVLKLSMFSNYQSCYTLSVFNGAVLELSENVLKLCMRMRSECITNVNSDNDKLSDKDHQTIMYISGYLISQLKKYACRLKEGEKVLDVVNSLISNHVSDNFVSKYQKWLKKINRGGLIIPCNDFFFLIRHCEIIVQKHVSSCNLSKRLLLKGR